MADHDQRFKVLLREYFAEFLELFFPHWAARLDPAGLEWLNTEFFSDPPRGERRHLDLVARLPARTAPTPTVPSGPWLVLVHIEVESADTVVPLHRRMFDYWWHLRVKHDLPVLPIGLYLQVGLEGVGWSDYREGIWEDELVHFRYAYVGLPELDAEDYVQRPVVLAAALAALMRVPDERRAALKAEAEQRVAASQENQFRRDLLSNCIDAYLPLEGAQLEEYNRLLASEPYTEARTMAQTRYERALATGIEQGIQRGIQQGMERGLHQGQRVVLLRQLTLRFGPLGEDVRQRLEAFPIDQLGELSEKLLTAATLRDLGLADE